MQHTWRQLGTVACNNNKIKESRCVGVQVSESEGHNGASAQLGPSMWKDKFSVEFNS